MRVRYRAVAAAVLLVSVATQAPAAESAGKPVVCIAGFLDETASPVFDVIKEIQPLTAEYLNRIGRVQHQSAEDIAAINSMREFMQLATSESRLADLEKIAAKGINKFIYLQLVQEVAAWGVVDALYGLVVDVQTREFAVVPLGTYNNKVAGAQGLPKEKLISKIKIARKRDAAAQQAAAVLSVFLTTENKAARDMIFALEDTRSAMKRVSYGKAIALIVTGGVMLAGMEVAASIVDDAMTTSNVKDGKDPDDGKYLVGALQIAGVAYALPIAIGFGNFGKRIGLGIQYNRLQRRFKSQAGVRYELPDVPRK